MAPVWPTRCQGRPQHQGTQLSGANGQAGLGAGSPVELASVQTPGRQPQADAVVDQDLHPGGAGIGKHIGMVRLRRTKDRDYAGQRRVGASTHVHRLDRQPGRIDANHRSQSCSALRHCAAAAIGQYTVMS
jgi:hypothetical protein